jgi:hypothetical protein
MLFLIHAELVHAYLFKKGLPVRGAIASGEYLVQENCFVGRSIVEAYRLAQTINLSAVVLTTEAAAELDRVATPTYRKSVRSYTRDYLVPLRSGGEQRYRAVCVHKDILGADDLRQFTYDNFARHAKDVSLEVQPKLLNTENFFRWCLI